MFVVIIIIITLIVLICFLSRKKIIGVVVGRNLVLSIIIKIWEKKKMIIWSDFIKNLYRFFNFFLPFNSHPHLPTLLRRRYLNIEK